MRPTWWTGASQMQAQRSRQSLLRWTRRRRRRCTSSSAPPHDGSQGNRHSRLFRLSPERAFLAESKQDLLITCTASQAGCILQGNLVEPAWLRYEIGNRLRAVWREPAGKMSLSRSFSDTSFFDNSLSTNGIIVDFFFLYSGFLLSRHVYLLCCLWGFLCSLFCISHVLCITYVAIKNT